MLSAPENSTGRVRSIDMALPPTGNSHEDSRSYPPGRLPSTKAKQGVRSTWEQCQMTEGGIESKTLDADLTWASDIDVDQAFACSDNAFEASHAEQIGMSLDRKTPGLN